MISISNKKKYSVLLAFVSPIAILIIWYIVANYLKSPLVLPFPKEVFFAFLKLAQKTFFWKQILFTIIRSLSAFCVSLILSFLLGLCCGLSKNFSIILSFPMSVIKATPVVSFILLALFWFTTNQVPVFVSVLMTLPVLTSAVAAGIKNTDKKLLQMANSYNLTKKQVLKNIYIPSTKPYLFSGALSAFGLSWKVVVASEVLSLPKYAAGTALYTAKVHLETADVFAISIVIILLSFLFEQLAKKMIVVKK